MSPAPSAGQQRDRKLEARRLVLFVSDCAEPPLLSRSASRCRPLVAVVSRVAEGRVWGAQASVVVVHELSCSVACGVFPDQGLNPCLLHWQEGSLPLRQGSPDFCFSPGATGKWCHVSEFGFFIRKMRNQAAVSP